MKAFGAEEFKRIKEVAYKAVVKVFQKYESVYVDEHDIEEVVSRTLLKVCMNLEKYDECVSRSAWFATIASNDARDYMRAVYKEKRLLVPLETRLDDGDEDFVMNYADMVSDDSYEADYELVSAERVCSVKRGMAGLGERASRAFTMLADGYSTEEVQAELEMKNGALRTMLSRGRARLAQSREVRELYVETYGHEYRDIA